MLPRNAPLIVRACILEINAALTFFNFHITNSLLNTPAQQNLTPVLPDLAFIHQNKVWMIIIQASTSSNHTIIDVIINRRTTTAVKVFQSFSVIYNSPCGNSNAISWSCCTL